ncbi:MAG: DUF6488 family protein [Desulfobacterales bacterium]
MFVSASHFFRRPIEYPLVCIAIAIILFSSSMVFAHGGMTHADNAFTPLQALQKATELFDRLVVSGKLDESWETDLKAAAIKIVEKNGNPEYRVAFERGGGEPSVVYIFFTLDGQYAGSNFEGE